MTNIEGLRGYVGQLMADERAGICFFDARTGDLPVMWARGKNLPEAWQNAMMMLFAFGADIKTSFDRPGDPESKDATVMMIVEEPLSEPRLHKLAWPGGFFDLEVYRLEVCWGIHNHWVERDKEVWNYTYNERLTAYEWKGHIYNQIEGLMGQLKKELEVFKAYRRRFQLTTWIPEVDQTILDPPCLQRILFRFLPTAELGSWTMNVNTDWRSRDGYKASFMNIYALTDLCRLIARRLSRETGQKIIMGRYCDKSDSLHIYGKDLSGAGGFDGFVKRVIDTPIDDLIWNSAEFADEIKRERHRIAAMLHTELELGLGKAVIAPGLDADNFPYPVEWDD